MRILWTRPALKDLARLDGVQERRIRGAVERLAQTDHGDVKRLTDVDPPEYRLRVGDWRVRYAKLPEPESALVVLRVLPRNQAYR